MDQPRHWLRRAAPIILLLFAIAWIITIFVWITVNPVEGPGNPMK